MIIEKTAVKCQNYQRPLYQFDSARTAFKQILMNCMKEGDFTLLLPGYIGISPKEGSGIFDPVLETGIPYVFYPLDGRLQIKCDEFKGLLDNLPGKKIVLIVHYFGYPDENLNKITAICKEHRAIIVEDAAHALYTDWIDHSCGQYGDFVIYSFHKMLPFEDGGGMKVNNTELSYHFVEINNKYPVFDYDLYKIACMRKRNAFIWEQLLKDASDRILVMRPYSENVTPQTFPIIVNGYDRNQLYFELNEAGFGAVSLYHTMIEPIRNANFYHALQVSDHIINMPVHQDVEEEHIIEMAKLLLDIVKQ